MAKEGALIPTFGVNVTIGAVANTKIGSCQALEVFVATEGTLLVRYRNSPNADTTHILPVGRQVIPGDLIQAWTGTVVLTPPSILLNA